MLKNVPCSQQIIKYPYTYIYFVVRFVCMKLLKRGVLLTQIITIVKKILKICVISRIFLHVYPVFVICMSKNSLIIKKHTQNEQPRKKLWIFNDFYNEKKIYLLHL